MTPDTVQFGFRLSTNPQDNDRRRRVRQELIRDFAISHAGAANVAGAELYPVARAGKSGSEVFYLDLSLVGFGFPERFVAKFQSHALTDREQESARRAQVAKLCSKVFAFKHPSEDLGLIVYDLAAANDHIEFRGFFLSLTNSDESCAQALRSVFQVVGRHPNTGSPARPLVADYSWYLNRKSQPVQRVEALASAPENGPTFRALAEAVLGYYRRIESQTGWEVHPYLVHGDLHARNLMLSQSNPARCELIDFGWVHFGHPVKDFVLMESTLKYMLLPELLPIVRSTSADALIPTAKTIDDFENYLWSNGLRLPCLADFSRDFLEPHALPSHQKRSLSRVYLCVQAVRGAADEVLRDYCASHTVDGMDERTHYFAGAFLMTFGLLGIQELDHFWALIGLNALGSHL